jgi:hypothetical protein
VTGPDAFHSISMMPVLEVTGPGMFEPEYASRSTFFVEHEMFGQLLSVILSLSNVLKYVKVKVMTAGYEIIADMDSDSP